MKEVTLTVEEKKINTFIEFVKTLDYVKVVKTDKGVLKQLERSLKDVKLMQAGKLPKKSAQQLIDELPS